MCEWTKKKIKNMYIYYQIYNNKSKCQKTFNLKIVTFNLLYENLHNIIKALDRNIFFVKNLSYMYII